MELAQKEQLEKQCEDMQSQLQAKKEADAFKGKMEKTVSDQAQSLQVSEEVRSALQQLLQDEINKASQQRAALATFELTILESAQIAQIEGDRLQQRLCEEASKASRQEAAVVCLDQALQKSNKEKDSLQSQLNVANKINADLSVQSKAEQEQLKEAANKVIFAEKQQQELQGKFEAIQKSLQQAKADQKTADQAAEHKLSEVQQQLQSEVTKAKEQEVALTTLTQDLQASAQATGQRLSEVQQQLQSEVTKAKEQDVALSTLTQDLQASAQAKTTLEGQLDEAEQKIAHLGLHSQAKQGDLKEAAMKAEKQQQELQERLEEAQNSLKQLKADHEKVQKVSERKLAQAATQNNELDASLKERKKLHNMALARVTALDKDYKVLEARVAEQTKGSERLQHELLKAEAAVDEAKQAKKAAEKQLARAEATNKKVSSERDGWQNKLHLWLARETALGTTVKKLQGLLEDHKARSADLDQRVSAAVAAKDQALQAGEQSKEVQQELQSVKDRAEKQEAALTALEQSLSASSKTRDELQGQLAKAVQKNASSGLRSEAMEQSLKTANDAHEEADQAKKTAEKQLEGAEAKNAELSSALQSEHQLALDKDTALDNRTNELEGCLEDHKARTDDLEQRVSTALAVKEETPQALEESPEVQQELPSVADQGEKQEAGPATLEQCLQDTNKAKDELERRLTKLQQRHADLWSLCEHVRQRNADLCFHLNESTQSLEEDGWPDKNAYKARRAVEKQLAAATAQIEELTSSLDTKQAQLNYVLGRELTWENKTKELDSLLEANKEYIDAIKYHWSAAKAAKDWALQGKKTAEERLDLTLIMEVTQHQSHQKLMSMLTLVTCQLHAAGRSVGVANKDSALQANVKQQRLKTARDSAMAALGQVPSRLPQANVKQQRLMTARNSVMAALEQAPSRLPQKQKKSAPRPDSRFQTDQTEVPGASSSQLHVAQSDAATSRNVNRRTEPKATEGVSTLYPPGFEPHRPLKTPKAAHSPTVAIPPAIANPSRSQPTHPPTAATRSPSADPSRSPHTYPSSSTMSLPSSRSASSGSPYTHPPTSQEPIPSGPLSVLDPSCAPPSTSTAGLSTSTAAPSTVTAAPNTGIQAPSTVTAAPSTSMAAHSTVIAGPSTSTSSVSTVTAAASCSAVQLPSQLSCKTFGGSAQASSADTPVSADDASSDSEGEKVSTPSNAEASVMTSWDDEPQSFPSMHKWTGTRW